MIIKRLKSNKNLMEITRFVITGGLSFIVDYGILIGLTYVFGINYLISSAISFTISVIINYFLCLLWAFEGASKNNDKKVVIMFVASSVVGLLLNQILMWIFVSVTHIHYSIAKIITTLLVMIWNYVMKKKALVK